MKGTGYVLHLVVGNIVQSAELRSADRVPRDLPQK